MKNKTFLLVPLMGVFLLAAPFTTSATETTEPTANILSNAKFETSNDYVDVAFSGDYVYTADASAGLNIIDVSDPASPTLVSNFDTDANTIYEMSISGNYAYLAGVSNDDSGLGKQLVIVDISNPTSPVLTGYYDSENIDIATQIAVSGNYAYLVGTSTQSVDYVKQLVILDISNPASPVLTGYYTMNASYCGDMTVAGNYVYLTGGDGDDTTLYVLDVSNPALPALIESYSMANVGDDIQIIGNYAYIGGANLNIFDISNPEDVTLVSSTESLTTKINVSGDYLYSVNYYFGLKIYNISDPALPVSIYENDIGEYVRDIVVNGDHAYAIDYLSGLFVVDISDKTAPVVIGHLENLSGNVLDIKTIGTYSYVLDEAGLYIMDVSDPTAPALIGSYERWRAYFSSFDISGNYAYLSSSVLPGEPTFDIVDISDPTAPVLVGTYSFGNGGGINALKVSGNYAYLTYWTISSSSLEIFDISDPTAPVLVSSYEAEGTEYGLFISDSYVYLTEEFSLSDSLIILDVSNPAAPSKVGGVYCGSTPVDVNVQGSYAYVINHNEGLFVVDVSNPAAPSEVGSYNDFTSFTDGIYALGEFAYIAADNDGVVVLNISDPSAPAFYAKVDDDFNDATVVNLDEDGTIYVGSNSLYVLRVDFDCDGVYDTTEILNVNSVDESEIEIAEANSGKAGVVEVEFANTKKIYSTIFKTSSANSDMKIVHFNKKYYLALRSDGKKLAIFDAKTGEVINNRSLITKYRYTKSNIILFTIKNKNFIGLTQKMDNGNSLFSLIQITSSQKLKVKDTVSLKENKIKVNKTSIKGRKVYFKNSHGKTLSTFKINKKYNLINKNPRDTKVYGGRGIF